MKIMIALTIISCILISGCNTASTAISDTATGKESTGTIPVKVYSAAQKGYVITAKIIKSDAEWKKELPPDIYEITRRKGTERPFTGATWNNHEHGIYRCICCGNDLFSSEHKYESGTGWPSFWQPIAPENVSERPDYSLFSQRTEVVCSRCDAHLGHVFSDGPKPTGLRYCMNSVALKFERN